MSKKFLTRLLSMILCAGLVLQPVTAFADDPVEGEVVEEAVVEETTDDVVVEDNVEAEEVEPVVETNADIEVYADAFEAPVVAAVPAEVRDEASPMDDSSLPVLKAWIEDGWLYIDSLGDDYFYDIVVHNGALTTSNIPYNLNKYCNEIGLASGSYKVTVQALKKHTMEVSSKKTELTYDFVADDIVLLPLTNVKIEDDILTFDKYADNCLYFVKVDNHDPIIATTNRVDLIYNFFNMGFTPGKYMLHITATKQNFKPISQTYDIEYAYAMEEPEPKVIVVTEDSISSDALKKMVKYGNLCEAPTFNSFISALEYTFDGWQNYYEGDEDNPEGWYYCKGFYDGQYRALLKVKVRDGYNNYALDSNFRLYVNGIGWHEVTDTIDEYDANQGYRLFVSPTYDIEAPELPEPTIISKVNIKTDPSLTFTIVDYGKCVEPTLIPETNGIKVTFLEWVRKNEEGDFESYKEDRFDVGYYKARFKVEIDPEYKLLNYLLDADCEYYMDGRDCSIVSRAYGPEDKVTVLSAVVDSPEFYSKFTYGEYLSRVRVENGVIRFDPYRGAAKYEIIIAKESFYTEDNFFDPTNAFYKKGLPFGSYTVYVRAVKSDLMPLSALSELRYVYNTLPEAGKHKIETINAKSNIAKIFVEGQKYENPTFEGPDTVKFMGIHWQKYLHEQFIPVTADDKDYFSEGKYRFRVLLHIDSEYFYTHEFADELKLIVDGVEWTADGVERYGDGKIMSAYFLSPIHTIDGNEDPDDPDEPKGVWETKYGATYYVAEDGTYLTGMQKIDGETYLFSNQGTLQKNVFFESDGNKYFFGEDGKMTKGWLDRWGATYYADENGVIQTGFVDIGDNTYYFDSKGKKTSSIWINENGNRYYIKADGRQAKSETIHRWGKEYSFDAAGALIK